MVEEAASAAAAACSNFAISASGEEAAHEVTFSEKDVLKFLLDEDALFPG